jgi:hypothetical protein
VSETANNRRGARSLVGCLVYLGGGLLLVLAACSYGVALTQERALAQGLSELVVSDYDDTGREIGSHAEPISAGSVGELRHQAILTSSSALVVLIVAFVLRGTPWSRLSPRGPDAPRTGD